MIEIMVYCAISLIGILFLMMAVRVGKLYSTSRRELDVRRRLKEDPGAFGLHEAQTFAETQLEAIGNIFGNKRFPSIDSVKEEVSLYLIGAVEMIGKHNECCANSRRMMTIKVLESRLDLDSTGVSKYYATALHRKQNGSQGCITRVGAKAAKMWIDSKSIPDDFSLRGQLLANA